MVIFHALAAGVVPDVDIAPSLTTNTDSDSMATAEERVAGGGVEAPSLFSGLWRVDPDFSQIQPVGGVFRYHEFTDLLGRPAFRCRRTRYR
jgi:hypothetical protein